MTGRPSTTPSQCWQCQTRGFEMSSWSSGRGSSCFYNAWCSNSSSQSPNINHLCQLLWPQGLVALWQANGSDVGSAPHKTANSSSDSSKARASSTILLL